MVLIAFLLVIYGLSNIIVNEDILSTPVTWIRKQNNFFDSLFGCTTCLSFWLGMVISLLFVLPLTGYWFDFIFAGLIASGFVNMSEFIKIKFM